MSNNNKLIEKLGLAAVSHDACNHIDAISLGLNQLVNGWHGNSLEEMKPLLIAILNTTDRVHQLVELQKIYTFQSCIQLETLNQINMLCLLQQTYLENLPLAKSRGLTLHYETSINYRHPRFGKNAL
ncbi:hypothetical protein A6770_32735 [Nostoc minutum NIES-26]|uniref:Uncharacterized protein n=1 Tax=Nostoc minutum NIES-26 TaxID=1844469 RepID=A0A367Q370_9NOSO|nr:hypothetical protein A6770_32735 [Nostoc minutum NIES-26]